MFSSRLGNETWHVPWSALGNVEGHLLTTGDRGLSCVYDHIWRECGSWNAPPHNQLRN